MKKLITFILGIAFVYGCSTSSDGNTTAVPVPPSNLTGTVAPSTQINLSWTDNSTNETGFKIERKTGTGTYAVVGTTATNITTFNDTGLSQGTTYTYRIFSYNAGGNSPTYSNELTLSTLSTSVTDVEGNTYQLVTICNQTWAKTNLNVSKYRNGDIIPQVTDATQWANLTTGAWCYYNNDQANGAIYGKLYNWYAVNDPRGLSPLGYHIPSDFEWNNLVNCIDTNANGATVPNVAGGAMKEIGTTHWDSPNTGATNIKGFTGLPGGFRHNNGTFFVINSWAYWWSSIGGTTNDWAYSFYIVYNNTSIIQNNNYKKAAGKSIRFIKD